MKRSPLHPVLQCALRLGGAPAAANIPDADLLRRFVSGDAMACEQLVRRHGPMVLGVCQRVLRDAHAAEDAFQATFLLLIRKAASLRNPDRLGPWLHGVAYRTSLHARSQTQRRRAESLTDLPAPELTQADDLRPELDAAIDRLPARERTAIVLCYLEGLTYADAARRLRCPVGTLAARLTRARERLRVRLTRQGFAPVAGLLTAALATDTSALPPTLIAVTVRTAAALALGATVEVVPATVLSLTRGVRRMMLLNAWKIVLGTSLALGVTGTGVGVLAYRSGHGQLPAKSVAPPAGQANQDAPANRPPTDMRDLPLSLLQQKQPEHHTVDAGDVLGIFIEGVFGERGQAMPLIAARAQPGARARPPAVGYPIPVHENGTIILPLIEPLPVRGKTLPQVQEDILKTYVSKHILGLPGVPPSILVALVKPRTYHVVVFRQAGNGPIAGGGQTVALRSGTGVPLDLEVYENDVLHALARSGSLPNLNADALVIQRNGARQPPTAAPIGAAAGVEQIRIPLRIPASQPLPFQPDDVILRTGDVLLIESREGAQPPEPDVTTAALPADRPPVMTLAVAAPDGRILIQVPASGPGPTAAISWRWQLFGTRQLKASETDGRPIDDKALVERLQKMAVVVVAIDGRSPDALYFQVVKAGTPVLLLQDTAVGTAPR